MFYVYIHKFQCSTVSSTTVKKWLLSSVVNEPTGPLNSQNVHCPINSATTEATAGHKFTYCLLMMHSWASRSRCCAWEACSDSSSGVVHPAEPRVASSWGPATQTQGMKSELSNQQTQSVPLFISLSSLSFAWKTKPTNAWVSGYQAVYRVEETEDWRHESRDEDRTG